MSPTDEEHSTSSQSLAPPAKRMADQNSRHTEHTPEFVLLSFSLSRPIPIIQPAPTSISGKTHAHTKAPATCSINAQRLLKPQLNTRSEDILRLLPAEQTTPPPAPDNTEEMNLPQPFFSTSGEREALYPDGKNQETPR